MTQKDRFPVSFAEEQGGELIERAAPCLPFVGSERRLVIDGIHTKLFKLLNGLLGSLTARILNLTAAVAYESQLVVLFELRVLLYVGGRYHSAAEYAYL